MLLALGGTIVLCWAVALSMLMFYLSHSQTSVWDSKLQAIATKILMAIPNKPDFDLRAKNESRAYLQPDSIPNTENLAFQVWIDRTPSSLDALSGLRPEEMQAVARTPGAPASPLKPDFVTGFNSISIDGIRWRAYSISDTTGRVYVQVGNLHSVIDSELQQEFFIALVINTGLLALVGGVMFCAVRKSLMPIVAIEAALRGREKFDLTPLPAMALPTELQPLVDSFNHLLVQLDESVESERRFIGDAAHELRTPLSALQTQAQVALGAKTLEQKDAALVKLLAVAERSTRLSEQLLDLARLNAGVHASHRAMAELSELVLHVSHEFEIYAQQKHRALFLATTPCYIACDVDEIGILLRNLVDNALRYTGADGHVRIACGYCMVDGKEQVYLEVADDGPGVPVEQHEAIFHRFYRVAGNGGRGSGIGLSLVSGIAQLHRATISTGPGLDGKGLAIKLVFPLPRDTGPTLAAQATGKMLLKPAAQS
jgi:signal transduction histidine kinase